MSNSMSVGRAVDRCPDSHPRLVDWKFFELLVVTQPTVLPTVASCCRPRFRFCIYNPWSSTPSLYSVPNQYVPQQCKQRFRTREWQDNKHYLYLYHILHILLCILAVTAAPGPPRVPEPLFQVDPCSGCSTAAPSSSSFSES